MKFSQIQKIQFAFQPNINYEIINSTIQLYWDQTTGNRSPFHMKYNQGCQYRTGGRTGLATSTIYFGYRSIQVYRFGFTAILYIYMYVCMYVCVFVYIYIIINIKVYYKTFSQFKTNYSWFQTLVSIKREKKNRKLKSYHCILRKQIILIS